MCALSHLYLEIIEKILIAFSIFEKMFPKMDGLTCALRVIIKLLIYRTQSYKLLGNQMTLERSDSIPG